MELCRMHTPSKGIRENMESQGDDADTRRSKDGSSATKND